LKGTSVLKEKRKHQRVRLNKQVGFKVAGESETCSGIVFDVSRGGLLLQAFKDIQIGAKILIQIVSHNRLESSRNWAVAEIVWKEMYLWDDWEGYQYGIKFIGNPNAGHSQGDQPAAKFSAG
jgi:hypothetical protein